jgi:competence protein ComEA
VSDEGASGSGPSRVHAHGTHHRRAPDGRHPDDAFPPEELFPPDERLPPVDAFPAREPFPPHGDVPPGESSPPGGPSPAEAGRPATATPATPLPGQRARLCLRLRVGVGAAAALVGAALVITILVTAYQAAQGGTTTGSVSAARSATAEQDAPASSGRGTRPSTAEGDASTSPSSGARGAATAQGSDETAADPGDGNAGGQPGAGSRTPIYVHVVGAVVSPGLFPLAPGSRVVDALAAAHGFADGADPAGVNLARVLTDGEQLVVPRQGESAAPASPGAAGGSATGASPSAPVDLNTATAEQLETLPRVGPSLAARIIAWRSAHGRFTRVADLGRVPGVGDRTLASLTPLVRV